MELPAPDTRLPQNQESFPRPLGYDLPARNGPLGWLQKEHGSPEARRLHEAFMHADQYQFYLHGALGDTIMEMAYLRGITAAIKRLRPDNPQITIRIPAHVEPLARYTLQADDQQITLVSGFPTQEEFRDQLTNAHDACGQSIFAINFPAIRFKEGGERIGGQIEDGLPQGVTLVSNVFTGKSFEGWTQMSGKGNRIRDHLRKLLSLSRKDIQKEDVEPVIKLPENEDQQFQELAQQYGLEIGEDTIQIGFALESAQKRKVYDLENWQDVMQGLAVAVKQRYPEKKINFNVFHDPNPHTRSFASVDLDQFLQTHIDGVKINPIAEPNLENVAILAKHQSLFLSTDSALGHIAAQVEDGPHVIGLFLNKILTRDVWTSTNRHHGITVQEDAYERLVAKDTRNLIDDDKSSTRYIFEARQMQEALARNNRRAVQRAMAALRERAIREAFADGVTDVINLIHPEAVVSEAMAYL